MSEPKPHPVLDLLNQAVVDEGLPAGVREYCFHPPRKWRFDLAWPSRRVAFEYEGGQFSRGRHFRPFGYARDCEKYNAAALDGWLVVRGTASMIDDGSALRDLLELLGNTIPSWDDVAGEEI